MLWQQTTVKNGWSKGYWTKGKRSFQDEVQVWVSLFRGPFLEQPHGAPFGFLSLEGLFFNRRKAFPSGFSL
jgi:hypothetical protein